MISVIMPAYNAGKTIRESIDSVIKQTITDWELIVIDDCSSDNTPDILGEYSKNDNRIIFLRNEKNMGVSYSRNKAVELAKGEWIAFLDSDDVWKPQKLEKQLELSNRYPEGVLFYTASSFIDENGKPHEYVMEALEEVTFDILLHKNIISCSSVLIKTYIMKQIKMPSDKMHEDYYVWLTVLKKYKVAYGINEPLLVYRLSSNSKSSSRIKSAAMLYNTYCAMGYNFCSALCLVFGYFFYSVNKRQKIISSNYK